MRWTRRLLAVVATVSALAVASAGWGCRELKGSLPQLDGRAQVSGLSAPVIVTRDALGIPTIRGRSRADVARATGFVHAQDRFFQMDLSRRRAAGELAALAGARALPLDIAVRLHRFRSVAQRALRLMAPGDREILEAYAAGVNAGLAALAAPPFEYLVLRQDPAPWRVEDSLLVVLSMFVLLQDINSNYESALATMRDVLPPAMFEFLASPGTEWDAPIAGARFSVPPVPGPDIYDLRSRRRGVPAPVMPERPADLVRRAPPLPFGGVAGPPADVAATADEAAALGSNNWAVAGRLTTDGGALLANDMHLVVRVPNTWYRASLEWPGGSDGAPPNRVIGVTLPGVPALVAGSNTHVAWGFTNTYADWGDLVLLDVDAQRPSRYRTPDGWREFDRHEELIEIAGGDAHHEQVTWTIWGPVAGSDHRGRLRAYRWVAHSAERLAASVTALESVRSLEEAFDRANGLGTPGQNIVAADRTGRIGWSIFGSIPRRVGLDGRTPVSWADGSARWDGWIAPSEYPRVIDPPGGRIWTANARVIDGAMLARLGDGSYEVGARATIIRDRLMAKDRFTAADMLDIQLDTTAAFLSRWRDFLLRALTPGVIGNSPRRAAFRDVVERGWTGQASADSAAYRLTRIFRDQVSERVSTFLFADCYEADTAFDHRVLRRREGVVWKLVTEQPVHLLDPRYSAWPELFAEAVDAVIEITDGDFADVEWSEYNVAAYRHPLSASLPLVWRWLDMPVRPLPGDLFTPRVQWGALAASQRMVVSPGREAEGYMHMPTGQSGHPLSPFYANSHDAWVEGRKTPFLPGEEMYRLELVPGGVGE